MRGGEKKVQGEGVGEGRGAYVRICKGRGEEGMWGRASYGRDAILHVCVVVYTYVVLRYVACIL